jgi:hypothetical protein
MKIAVRNEMVRPDCVMSTYIYDSGYIRAGAVTRAVLPVFNHCLLSLCI